jgi:xanthine dehydrogenase accessory factor
MKPREFFERVAELERARTPFALATVVTRKAPVSAHLGDRAIVFSDGRMQGFVGGSCSRDIVRRQAVDAMRSGNARLVQIRPDAQVETLDARDAIVVPMSCASEGAVDIYIEPHLPARTLLIAGLTPVADELARLSAAMDGYRAMRVVHRSELQDLESDERARAIALDVLRQALAELDAVDRPRLLAVVASQGNYDEAALRALLEGDAPAYIGLLASRKRAAEVFAVLEGEGVPRERLARVRNPAGLDIGARRPSEVAVSILAEIVAVTSAGEAQGAPAESSLELAVDPVCGMDVDPARATYQMEHHGRSYFFCCPRCRAAFAAEPQHFAAMVDA